MVTTIKDGKFVDRSLAIRRHLHNISKEASKLVFNFTVNHPDETKAVKVGWQNGDLTPCGYLAISKNGYQCLASG